MDEGPRKRRINTQDGCENVGNKERNSIQECTKRPSIDRESTNASFPNVPKFEVEDGLTSADSLYSSTCSSGEFYECSGNINSNKVKTSRILAALRKPVDRKLLRSLARSEGGLLTDVIRRKAWPELLDINNESTISCAPDVDIEQHKEYHQVVLDVSRSLKRFPPGISDFERKILQEQLLKLILSVIIKHPYLSYYQGYHDVAVTLLLVVGDEKENVHNGDEDDTEGFGESVSSNNDFEDSSDLITLTENGLNFEQVFSHARVTEDNGANIISLTAVTENNTVGVEENNVKDAEHARKTSTCEDLLSEDNAIGSSVVNDSIIVEGKPVAKCLKDISESGVEVTDEETDTVKTSLNGVKVKTESGDESESNFGETWDQDWDSTISEKENLDSASSGHLISMWCNSVALKMLEHVSLNHFRDCMGRTMDATSHLLHHVFPIVEREDRALCDFLDESGVGTMFCLPWVLTWFSHNINNHDIVVRLYDYFLASPVASPLYIAAAIILHRKNDIFETECEMPALHGLLSKIPDDLPFEKVLVKASDLYEAYPPESLKSDVEERSNRDRKQLEERRKQIALRGNAVNPDLALVPWRLLALLPPGYADRLVPWFMIPGRMWWLTRVIPRRHLRSRFVLAAIPIAMYYAYSHLLTNTSG
ncbi:uncharacterized protein LOC124155961 [Ischnura elegans]|uniref:uncharacterized protein LOC124155961 n=1 Tax=Ischnura elegans TaxID=197161 RepID=UPI001ED88247|nr:uncharacterized protein LOC124155961 [Ischnura elegans]